MMVRRSVFGPGAPLWLRLWFWRVREVTFLEWGAGTRLGLLHPAATRNKNNINFLWRENCCRSACSHSRGKICSASFRPSRVDSASLPIRPRTNCVNLCDITWEGRNTVYNVIYFDMLELSDACVTWQTTVNRTHRTYTWLTQTESFAEWQKAGADCTSRAFKLSGHDITRTWRLAVNLTDYTYDSELDIADDVPHSVRCS